MWVSRYLASRQHWLKPQKPHCPFQLQILYSVEHQHIHGPREKLWHIKTWPLFNETGWWVLIMSICSHVFININVIYNFYETSICRCEYARYLASRQDLAKNLEIDVFFCNVVSILPGICHMHHMWYRSLLWHLVGLVTRRSNFFLQQKATFPSWGIWPI